MFIDKDTGTIKLPNGLVITTELNKSGFEDSTYFSQATPYDYGTMPFQWYRLEGGQLDGHILNVNICFYSEVLVDFRVSANFYKPNSRTWEDFSLETEGQSKTFHDELLQKILGSPHKKISLPSGKNRSVLDYRLDYRYKWGIVWSVHDSRGGSTYIGVRYGSRLKDAQENYRAKRA